MRKIAILTTCLSLAFASSAFAGAKDKSSNTLVDINATGIINNTTVKTKTKSKGCTLQIQAKPIGLADGAVAICIAEGDVLAAALPPGGAGNSIVLAGEAKAGQLKIKADLSEGKFGGLGCGDTEAISFNGNLRCFSDDPVYRGDANVPGSWRAQCVAAGMVAAPDGPGTTKLKVNDTQSVVVGLCQGLALGLRIDPPATTEWGRQGARSAVVP
jgi:hypothetical protein